MSNCWYNEDIVPGEMIRGAKAEIEGWCVLEETPHFIVLKELLEITGSKSIVDIGCGAAELSRVFPDFQYVGVDLPHIIDKVSKKMHPNNQYIYCDAIDSDFAFIKNKGTVVMNSFLSELEKPLVILENILSNADRYIIIHRQELTEKESYLEEYKSYGGMKTTRSFINRQEFTTLLNKYGYREVVLKSSNSVTSLSILLERI